MLTSDLFRLTCNIITQICKSHINIFILYVDIIMLHVNKIILHDDIDSLRTLCLSVNLTLLRRTVDIYESLEATFRPRVTT